MADAKKHFCINGGTLMSELFKPRKTTMAFVYGFMFAFVCFTVFLAFNPSPNSSSPWISNIFSANFTESGYYRSRFSSYFTYLLPASSNQENPNNSTSINPQINANRSSSPVSPPPITNQTRLPALPTVQNHTQVTEKSNDTVVSSPVKNLGNQSLDSKKNVSSPVTGNLGNQSLDSKKNVSSPVTGNSGNQSLDSKKDTSSPVIGNLGKNQSLDSKKDISSPVIGNLGKNQSLDSKKDISSPVIGNLGKNQSLNSRKDVIESLMKCDFFDGDWVIDDSYPLYKPGSCSLIDEQFNCIINGRPDKNYQKYRWKPNGCSLPRLNGSHMLELLRGKRLVFVGDSLNRNMWESLVCILKNSVKDQTKVFEANGHQHFRGEASYSFKFQDYDATVEFFVSPFLVREWEITDKKGTKKETLRLDLVGKSSDEYKHADIIIFNTGHWWTHDKTSKGQDYYQEGNNVYHELNVLEAFRKALTTWARWIDANVNPTKSLVFFRGYSASHFSGGQWNSGGACDHETDPIKNQTYLTPYPTKMMVLEKVLKNMKTRVLYQNVTRMTDFRKDAHPSVYRKLNLSEVERISPMHFQDCSHWCLPGVPDIWNEILYAELLVKQKQKLH